MNDPDKEIEYYTYSIRIRPGGEKDGQVDIQVFPPGGGRPGESPGGKLVLGDLLNVVPEVDPAKYTQAQGEQLGQRLFEAIFEPTLAQHFRDTLRDRENLRIELDVDEQNMPKVAALPWEFLYIPQTEKHQFERMGTSPKIAMYRYRSLWYAAKSQSVDGPLRILFVVSDPKLDEDGKKLGEVAYEEVLKKLIDLTKQYPERIELLEPVLHATIEQLRTTLEKQKPQVLHFIGHGQMRPDEQGHEYGALALCGTANCVDWRRDKDIAALFDHHKPGLIVFQTCESGKLSSGQAFAGIASQLMHRNIPAIIAMQYKISNNAAVTFAQEFYELWLVKDAPVDVAVQKARYLLRETFKDCCEYAIPIVFRQNIERIDELLTNNARSLRLHYLREYKGKVPPKPDLLIGREQELITLRNALHALLTGPAGIGKTLLASKLIHEYEQDVIFWYSFIPGHNDTIKSVLLSLACFLYEVSGYKLADPLKEIVSDYEDIPKTKWNLHLNHLIKHFVDKEYVICFDDVHKLRSNSEYEDFVRLFQILIEGLGATRLLIISRNAFPASLTSIDLEGLPLDDFRRLLLRKLSRIQEISPVIEVESVLSKTDILYSKLGGNPQYLDLFIKALSRDVFVLDRIETLGHVDTISGFILSEIAQSLEEFEQAALTAIAILEPSIARSFLIQIISSYDSTLSDEKIKNTIQFLYSDHEELSLHDSERYFWLKEFVVGTRMRPKIFTAIIAAHEKEPHYLARRPLQLANCYLEVRRIADSFKILRQDYFALMNYGKAELLLNELLKPQFEYQPEIYIQVLKLRGDLYRHLGRYREAAQSHNQALQRACEPESRAELLLARAEDYISWGQATTTENTNYDRAKADLLEAAQIPPEHLTPRLQGRIHYRLGYISGHLSDYDQEQQHAETARDFLSQAGNYPYLIRADCVLAEAYAKGQNDYPRAISILNEAEFIATEHGLEQSPEMSRVYSNRGLYHAKNRALELAKQDFDRALEINQLVLETEQEVIHLANLGSWLADTGQWHEAIRYRQQAVDLALRIESQYRFMTLWGLAAMQRCLGLWDTAAETLAQIEPFITTDDHRGDWRVQHMHLLRDKGLLDTDHAAAHWRAALNYYAEIAALPAVDAEILQDAQGARAEVLALLEEDLETALSAAEAALEGQVEIATGAVQTARGEWDAARSALEAAQSFYTDPHEPYELARVYYYQGRLAAAQNQPAAACAAWETSLQLFRELESRDYIRLLEATLKRNDCPFHNEPVT